jgi:hypothetical protein
MKRGVYTLLTVLVSAAASQVAQAASINVSTGLDASNNVITTGGVNDAHWQVTVDPTFSPTGIPQTVFPGNPDSGFPNWSANGPNSDWIARNANVTDNGPAPYTFSTTFNLTGFNLSQVSLAGSWWVDDIGTLNLNGHQLGSLGSGAWVAPTAFSVAAGSSFLNQGLNTLSITITSNDRFLEGVRLEGSVSGVTAVPEPAALVLGGISLLIGIGCWWRRRTHVGRCGRIA